MADSTSRKKSAGARKPRARKTGSQAGTAQQPEARHAFPVVGIGASAGGLEAMSELLDNLPADTGMAFVLVQHLAPKHRTILPEILARRTPMPVILAENEMEVRPNSVYVIAPDRDLTIFHGRLNLMERTNVAGAHLPVDFFLRSLAIDQRTAAIGIILSGSGSDGALGMAAIKAEGGITFVQEPHAARYDGMPQASISGNAADFILEVPSIATELTRLGQHPYLVKGPTPVETVKPLEAERDVDWYKKIFVLLRSVFGVDFSGYRMSTIQRRIERRLALFHLDSVQEYVDYLREHPDEAEELYHDILIRVTEFFREPESYEVLTTTVLPRILEEKRDGDQVRIWVPGCASGEEPYSIAMSTLKAMKNTGREFAVKIFGTDISDRDVDLARAGIYTENKLQAMPDEFRRYFTQTDGRFQISKSVREMCIFARHDVTTDPPFSQLDLVSCRNLLIYLDTATQERVMPVFHYSLRPGGYLILGQSESIGSATDLFSPVDAKFKVFLRRSVPHRLPVVPSRPYTLGQDLATHGERPRLVVSETRFDPQHTSEEILLNAFTPPSVVIDDRFVIVQFHGDTDPFLVHGPGRASLNLIEMAREGLAPAIRKLVSEARKSGKSTHRETVRFRQGDLVREASMSAVPMHGPSDERFFLLVFELAPMPDADGLSARNRAIIATTERDETGQRELERELTATREYMQSLVQDKEAALEELRAANEEVQSSNEELQSINEELETAKEELQSTNEELRTVNEELEHRNRDLSRANNDLNNLLRAVSVPTIMVGRDLRVQRFTPGAERVMNLIPTDIGRPITDIVPRLTIDGLDVLLQDVIENMTVREQEVRDEAGVWYSMRVRPYQTEENQIDGAVITLFEINELREAVEKAVAADNWSAGLNDLIAKLGEGRDGGALKSAIASATSTLKADIGLVVTAVDGGWRLVDAYGVPRSLVGQVIDDDKLPQATMADATRAPVVAQATAGEVLKPSPAGLSWHALLAVPMVLGNRVGGVLLFGWSDAATSPSVGQADFAGKAAFLFSLSFERWAAKT